MNLPTPALAPLEIDVIAGLDPDGTPVIRRQWQQGEQGAGLDRCPHLAQTVADQLNQASAALAAVTKGEKTP